MVLLYTSAKYKSIVGFFVCLAAASSAFADDARTVREIVEAWQGLQQRFDLVRFAYSGSVTTAAGFNELPSELLGSGGSGDSEIIAFPPDTTTHSVGGTLLLDLAGGRVHFERTGQELSVATGEAEMTPIKLLAVFDGATHQYYEPDEGKISIHEAPRKVFFRIDHDPLLLTCGAIYFTMIIDAGNLRMDIDPNRLSIDNDNVMHDGRRCVVVRTTPDVNERFFEYWVDADDPRMIVQFNGYNLNGEGKLWLSTTIDYRDTEWGPIPDHWTAVKYSFMTGKPETYEVQLDDFEANPAVTDADFEIDPPPGTQVYDGTRPAGDRRYVVAEPGQPNLPVGEFVLQQEQSRYNTWMYVGLAAVVAMVITAVVVKRRREA